AVVDEGQDADMPGFPHQIAEVRLESQPDPAVAIPGVDKRVVGIDVAGRDHDPVTPGRFLVEVTIAEPLVADDSTTDFSDRAVIPLGKALQENVTVVAKRHERLEIVKCRGPHDSRSTQKTWGDLRNAFEAQKTQLPHVDRSERYAAKEL